MSDIALPAMNSSSNVLPMAEPYSVLFVIPPELHYIESNVSQKIEAGREFRQKLGILAVAGYARENTPANIRILDCLAEGFNLDDMANIIKEQRPDLVGFSVLTFNVLDCMEAARGVRTASPNTRICMGGFHPTIYPLETLNLSEPDYVVVGDGEITFSELINELITEKNCDEFDLGGIAGLGWKDAKGKNILNRPRPMVSRSEYDSFPMPAHDLLDIEKYSPILADSARVASIQTSRGCPGKCTFCDIRQTAYKFRSTENILEEICYLESLGVSEFFIIDDTFTINRKRVFSLCDALIERDLNIRFKISSRVDSVDKEMLEKLEQAGCYRIHFGVESGSQRLLDRLQKEITLKQIQICFEETRDAGIESFAYMMIGIPTETKDEIYNSINFVDTINPYHANYSICTPFPKTKLYEDLLAAGIISSDYWKEFAEKPDPNFKLHTANEYFDTNELREFQDKALRSFYRSPVRIVREIIRTRSLSQLGRKIKVGMGILWP